MTLETTITSVDVDGVVLNVHTSGQGQPVLWLHGGGPGASGYTSFGQSLPLLTGYRHVVPDLPGFGRSPAISLDDGPIIDRFAAITAGLLDALGIERAVLIGNALGAAIAIKLAADRPAVTDKLVLLAPAGFSRPGVGPVPAGLQLAANYASQEKPDKTLLAEILRAAVRDQSLINDEMLEKRYAASLQTHPELPFPPNFGDVADDLARVSSPTLVLWGTGDQFSPIDGVPVLARGMPDACIVLLPRCGHWPQFEQPSLFARAVGEFLKG